VERLLFAESGCYCANPECPSPYLFRDHSGHELEEDHIPTVANIAHVIADSPDGPRGSTDGGQRDRAENLVLLCANCHNIVDDMRLNAAYSVERLLEWKRSHRDRVASQFIAREFATRIELNSEIARRLRENHAIWQQWGPEGIALSQDPAATDVADEWRRRARETILPNNRRILAVADRNAGLLTGDELGVVEHFRVHAEGFARGQLGNPVPDAPRFPPRINEIFPGTTG
jgi:hypothetical protein